MAEYVPRTNHIKGKEYLYNPLTNRMWQNGDVAPDGTEYVVTRKDIPALLVRISHLNRGSLVETAAPLVYDRPPPGREWRWKK